MVRKIESRTKKVRKIDNKLMIFIVIILGVVVILWIMYYMEIKINLFGISIFGEEKTVLYSISDEGMEMDMEDYIPGVVMSIVPIDYEIDTIKAMSVLVRSYIVSQLENSEQNRINIDELDISGISPQALRNTLGNEIYDETMKKYEQAVRQTKGEVIYYNKKVITPLYHMVSAGRTRNGYELFEEDIPYLTSVDCSKDVESSDYLKIYEIDKDTFDNEVGKNAKIAKRDSAGYVLEVESDKGVVDGEKLAGKFELNSSNFTIDTSNPDIVRIVSKGKGHGMGLSLYGANELAKSGMDYKSIIASFYKGTQVKR